MLKSMGILERILASWLASVEEILEHYKGLLLTIKHNVDIKSLCMVIFHRLKQFSCVPLMKNNT